METAKLKTNVTIYINYRLESYKSYCFHTKLTKTPDFPIL